MNQNLILKVLAAFFAVFLGFVLMVEVLGYVTWALTPRDKASLERALRFEREMARNGQSDRTTQAETLFSETDPPRPKVGTHSVGEWPANNGRDFAQAPELDKLVSGGALPPVSERLPENPLVIIPPEQNGPYGGTWTRFGNGPQDVGILEARLAYDGLVRWDAMSREILPNLAVRWHISADSQTYTVWLRKGVRWSDGHPCTVDDIVFWYDHVLRNAELTPVVPRDFKRGGEVMQLVKLDDYTVRFHFKEPHGLFLYALASGRGYEMLGYPAHYLQQYHAAFVPQANLEKMAQDAGLDLWNKLFDDKRDWRNIEMPRLWPWLIKEPPPARPVVLERNPYYWKVDPDGNQLPYIDRMTFEIYDAETINFKAINGEIGMQSRHLMFTNYPLLMENRKKGGYRVLHWTPGNGGDLAILPNLNHKDPVMRAILEDHRFRKALSLAIDRDEINEVGYFSVGTPRQMAPPKASDFYSSTYEIAYVEHDLDRANALLDEMNLVKRDPRGVRLMPNGKPLKLSLESATVRGGAVLLLVVDHWRQLGIDADVKDLARQLWQQRVHGKLHDVTAWGSSDEQIPLLDPRWLMPDNRDAFHAPGYGRWFNTDGKGGEEPPPELKACMAIFREIERTSDRAEHIRLFKKIIALNEKYLWTIGLIGEIPAIFVVKNSFRNVPDNAVTGWMFRTPGNTAVECYAIEN
ncbi:MAG: ABC transporter substrate-binding protein [Candidatus Latescibacteria bacterium]|nr:ABC transporter substrate-binding protein [Candidatus Latescibacterota bacterium]MBT5828778.1 ABC transporter substrate-binding protein [Candidatus Latescibacterota bacterium]